LKKILLSTLEKTFVIMVWIDVKLLSKML